MGKESEKESEPEKTQEETSRSDPLAWTDMVDEGVSYLDQLAVQRSRELKKAVAEWMTPKTQTPRISTNFGKSSRRRFRDADTQTQISCHQHGATQSRKVNSPKHE